MWTPDEVDCRVWGWRYQEQVSTNGSTVLPTERSRICQVAAQRRRILVQAKFVFMQTVTVRPSCVGRLRRVHCLCDMCRYYCLLRAGKKSLINKTLVEMTTRKKSRSNLKLSKRTKERRCTARKPNLWIGEHENQFLLCVLFSFVVHYIPLDLNAVFAK